jgi:hypothetical protein
MGVVGVKSTQSDFLESVLWVSSDTWHSCLGILIPYRYSATRLLGYSATRLLGYSAWCSACLGVLILVGNQCSLSAASTIMECPTQMMGLARCPCWAPNGYSTSSVLSSNLDSYAFTDREAVHSQTAELLAPPRSWHHPGRAQDRAARRHWPNQWCFVSRAQKMERKQHSVAES